MPPTSTPKKGAERFYEVAVNILIAIRDKGLSKRISNKCLHRLIQVKITFSSLQSNKWDLKCIENSIFFI